MYEVVTNAAGNSWMFENRMKHVVDGDYTPLSMVDIFVITILVALVELGTVADIDAGPAALFFAIVVIITMIAAMSFDPRLIWDAQEPYNDRT